MLRGNVTSDGGATVTSRGVCYSTSQNPQEGGSCQDMGVGIGAFSATVSGLSPNTTYYFVAYAINSQGTAYGQVASFTTKYQPDSIGTVMDIDGNVYNTVKIGNRWWMSENLKVTHYNNGDAIPNVGADTEWSILISGAYCEYDNNPWYVEAYGRLYNWYAISDRRNISLEGWHIPTDEEWKELEIYLGMDSSEVNDTGNRGTNEGFLLKSDGGWPLNGNGSNEYSFSALPGGYRLDYGLFYNMGYFCYFWSSTEYESDNAWDRLLHYQSARVNRNFNKKCFGFSVRCIKD